MQQRSMARGLVFMAIALVFGLTSLGYPVGSFAHSGPGLFPLLVSGALFAIGLATAVRARFEAPQPLHFNLRHIGLILASLIGFALIAQWLDMAAAIVFLVGCSTLAGSDWSLARNLRISAVLIAIALAFEHFLGLALHVF